jgi:hypothetical protein
MVEAGADDDDEMDPRASLRTRTAVMTMTAATAVGGDGR